MALKWLWHRTIFEDIFLEKYQHLTTFLYRSIELYQLLNLLSHFCLNNSNFVKVFLFY